MLTCKTYQLNMMMICESCVYNSLGIAGLTTIYLIKAYDRLSL